MRGVEASSGQGTLEGNWPYRLFRRYKERSCATDLSSHGSSFLASSAPLLGTEGKAIRMMISKLGFFIHPRTMPAAVGMKVKVGDGLNV